MKQKTVCLLNHLLLRFLFLVLLFLSFLDFLLLFLLDFLVLLVFLFLNSLSFFFFLFLVLFTFLFLLLLLLGLIFLYVLKKRFILVYISCDLRFATASSELYYSKAKLIFTFCILHYCSIVIVAIIIYFSQFTDIMRFM